jgi:hypothetical protein
MAAEVKKEIALEIAHVLFIGMRTNATRQIAAPPARFHRAAVDHADPL